MQSWTVKAHMNREARKSLPSRGLDILAGSIRNIIVMERISSLVRGSSLLSCSLLWSSLVLHKLFQFC
ncbi:hypothetical protein MPTK1_2g01370 [Marchantia polymorpha subsp. ruderalis]|uniref:Uncharacterized protein n=1 Tax=Marchantia polymorpha TaxID=3197 RepID=A0A2R6X9C8_MARPO|nr:hypothetical protein MARPO_0028s0015 [Marchantia polymorpha]BBN00707.1 hypothetical protein Mp_2g01370 [Marchantia polymorpha subsp. ruderalis]|eukprot:PTQ42689.1 hypothetical protein MARPO_0028s0015 [Marchantia polymorpha]